MGKRCGIWIDHRKAVVASLDGSETVVRTFESHVDRARHAGGSPGITARGRARGRAGSRAGGPQDAVPEDKLERKRTQALGRYYARVVEAVADVEELLIAGPGEAKDELRQALLEHGAGAAVVGFEPADKMTERQWVARVRELFGEELPRVPVASPGSPID